MDYPGSYPALVPAMGFDNRRGHPWIQARQVQEPGEQQVPFMDPGLSYVSQLNLPSGSHTRTRVITHNYESILYVQTYAGVVLSSNCLLTIPIELLDGKSTLPTVGLKEVVFLGPHYTWSQTFLHSRDDHVARATTFLKNVWSLKKITFSLDLLPITGILGALAVIHDLEEIVLTLSTARALTLHEMFETQQAFIDGLEHFNRHGGRIKRLTFPMEFVTPLLLSYLTRLPHLESLTAKYSPPQHPTPGWSSYQAPKERPGYTFLKLLNFDPRHHFHNLRHLELGVSSSDSSYSKLKKMFPRTYIC